MEVKKQFRIAFNMADLKAILVEHIRGSAVSESAPYPPASREAAATLTPAPNGLVFEWTEEYET